MRKCPNCGGKYADHVKKCSACNVPTEEWLEELPPITDYDDDEIDDDEIDDDDEEHKNKIVPTSLGEIRLCGKRFRTAYILNLIFAVVCGVLAGSFFKEPLIGIAVAVVFASGSFLLFMFSALFHALYDIIVALYHIANK